MGWSLPKLHRDNLLRKCMTPARAAKTKGGKLKTKSGEAPEWPASAHVFVDAPAMLRSNAVDGRSPIDVANSVLHRITAINPARAEIIFDKADQAAYPPQRHDVHAVRASRAVAITIEQLHALMRKYGAGESLEALSSVDVSHLPYLQDRTVKWSVLFANTNAKALAWNLLATAIRYVFTRHFAAGGKSFPVRIYRPDGRTVHSIQPTAADPPPALCVFGEADLAVFHAARLASTAGNNVCILSVDTDFILMTLCSATFTPKHAFIIALKSGIVDGQQLVEQFGSDGIEARLNKAFLWIMFGCDYSQPFTRLGYYTKGILELETTSTHAIKANPDKPDVYTFDHRTLQAELGRLKQRKTKLTVMPTTFYSSALYCLQYYGFLFDATVAPFPPPIKSWWNWRDGPAEFIVQ
jgi:hypothetical protein